MKGDARLLVVCALVLSLPCSAQSLPQGIFSIGHFEVGKATIDDVQSHFGPNKPYAIESGDGADVAVCYSNGMASSAPAIVFETGALGGWKEITAYRLTKRDKHQCRLTNVPLSAMSTGNGLTLNAKRQLVANALSRSKPVMSPTKMRVEEVYQRTPTDAEAARMRRSNADPSQVKFDVVDTVEIRFKRGVVDDLYVRRLVSY